MGLMLKRRVVLIVALFCFNIAFSKTDKLTCFLKEYPLLKWDKKKQMIINPEGDHIPWKEDKQKSFDETLADPSIGDTLSIPYKKNKLTVCVPYKNHDPGRFRNSQLLKTLYGRDQKDVKKNLVKVIWIDYQGKKEVVYFNRQQGAAQALSMVSHELNKLSNDEKSYLYPLSGTYVYRKIKGTDRLSPHAYGIAIDINVRKSHYWKTSIKKIDCYPHPIPQKIIDIFEANGFIWGGRWHHYDTMHFEYRPEIIHCS